MASNKDKIDCIGKALLNLGDEEEEPLSLRETIFQLTPFIAELLANYKQRKTKSKWKRVQARLLAQSIVIDLQLLQNYYHQAKREQKKEAPAASSTTQKPQRAEQRAVKTTNSKPITSSAPVQGTHRPRRTVT